MIAEEFCGPIQKDSVEGIPESLLKAIYRMMLKIRLFEEKIASLVEKKEVITPCHLYIGQEAVATGVCMSLKKDDFAYSTHRSHGHYIAKGGDIGKLMAEIFGKVSGCSGGYGGSMHLCSPGNGLPGSSSIVGGTIPIAVGTALAMLREGKARVSVAFFGDGAATEGVLYESLNFSKLKNLPVVFICENNFYSTHMHISSIQSNIEIYKKAESFDIPSCKIDGNDVIEVYKNAKAAIELARQGNGPSFLECVTYRWRGHVGPNWDLDRGLRSKEEVDWWVNNCAIRRMEELLTDMGVLNASEKSAMNDDLKSEIEESLEFAKKSPFPEVDGFQKKVFK